MNRRRTLRIIAGLLMTALLSSMCACRTVTVDMNDITIYAYMESVSKMDKQAYADVVVRPVSIMDSSNLNYDQYQHELMESGKFRGFVDSESEETIILKLYNQDDCERLQKQLEVDQGQKIVYQLRIRNNELVDWNISSYTTIPTPDYTDPIIGELTFNRNYEFLCSEDESSVMDMIFCRDYLALNVLNLGINYMKVTYDAELGASIYHYTSNFRWKFELYESGRFEYLYVLKLAKNVDDMQFLITTREKRNILMCDNCDNSANIYGDLTFLGEGRIRVDVTSDYNSWDMLDFANNADGLNSVYKIYENQSDGQSEMVIKDSMYYDEDMRLYINTIAYLSDSIPAYYRILYYDAELQCLREEKPGYLYLNQEYLAEHSPEQKFYYDGEQIYPDYIRMDEEEYWIHFSDEIGREFTIPLSEVTVTGETKTLGYQIQRGEFIWN